MVSRKKVQSHIYSKQYIKHLDLDVFVQDGMIRIIGKGGIDQRFASDRAAKTWVTKLDNQELCRRANSLALA